MASRVSLPRVTRPSISVNPGRIGDAWRALTSCRLPRGAVLRQLLFQIVTLAFWFISDIPAPRLPRREVPIPGGGRAGDHMVRQIDSIAVRIWGQRMLSVLIRVIWLPMLVGCVWLALEIAEISELRISILPWIGVALILPGIAFALLIRPTRHDIARMLDRSYDLQDRMVTALEHIGHDVPIPGAPASVTYLQVADAANVATALRARRAFKVRPPVREIVLAVGFSLVFSSLFFLRGSHGQIPDPVDNPVPAFVPAAVRLAAEKEPAPQANAATADAPSKADVQAKSARSNQAQQDLKKLANALSDQAVTRSAAEAIQEGDFAKAADLIRQVAENADQLSESTREGLADDLDAAADAMSPGSESLAQSARDAATGLREGGEAARDGMQELGDEVDRTASDIVSQQELASEMQQAEASSGSQSESQSGGSSSGDPSEGAQESPGETPDEEEPGTGGDSSGADARPGEAEGDPEGNTPGSSGSNDTGGQDSQGSNDEGQSDTPGKGAPEGESASQSGEGDQIGNAPAESSGEDNNELGATGDGGDAGAGAGSGGSGESESGKSGNERTDAGSGDGPAASEPSVTDAESSSGDGTEPETDPRSSITLARSQDADGVQTSSNGGAATSGSGGGASLSGGTGSQGEVGDAGPDSNRVPAEYRGIVEDYFSENEGS